VQKKPKVLKEFYVILAGRGEAKTLNWAILPHRLKAYSFLDLHQLEMAELSHFFEDGWEKGWQQRANSSIYLAGICFGCVRS
jgi:hypothetical protein